jgi:hypothetical protein
LLQLDRAARREHGVQADGFTQPLVRHRNGRGLADRRIGEQHVLDLLGGNVLAAADDQILLATRDQQSIAVTTA